MQGRQRWLVHFLGLLLMGYVTMGANAEDGRWCWRVPDDQSWEKVHGSGEIKTTDDGWVWDAQPVDRGGQLGVRLPVDLSEYDEIRFEYKPTHGPVQVVVTTDGYPTDKLSRNWYDKNVQKLDEWNSVAFELDLDDDGRPTERPETQDLWIRFGFHEDPEVVWGDRRRVEFRNVRLVRHPVEWHVDYFRTRTRRIGDVLEIAYPISLRNRTSQEVNVTLELERMPPRTGEPLFDMPEQMTWSLAPPSSKVAGFEERWGGGVKKRGGDAVGAWITFTADATEALVRSPLWTEMVWPRVRIEGYDEVLLPLHSSRLDPWFLTVPPRSVVHPVVEATPDKLRRAMRRNSAPGRFQGILDDILSTARRQLASPFSMPRQITLEGNEAYSIHSNNGLRCLNLARAWALTGDESYRTAAIDVLQAYADNYPLWEPLRESSTAFRSRTMSNTLMEGFRMWSFFVAYDYLRSSLTILQIEDIEGRFLLPLARVLDGHVLAYNNQMTQHQHNVFYFAVATENWPLAMRYVEGPRGLFAIREYGFDVDGMGMERDMGYHWNTLDPMVGMMVTLGHLGFDDTGLDIESLLSAPAALGKAMEPTSRYPYDRSYEWGYEHYGNNGFINSIGGRGLSAILYGVEQIPEGEIALDPVHLKHAGYVLLRRRLPDGGIRSLSTNYGSPHHRNHADLLSVHVEQDGNTIVGMMGQQFGRTGWYSTMADSLLVVNGRDQLVGGRGRLVRIEQGEKWQAVEVATSDETSLYDPAVTYHRLLVDADSFVVLLDRATAPEPVTFQWTFYPGIDYTVPEDWSEAEAPSLDAGPTGNGPGCETVRKDWRAGSHKVSVLKLSAEFTNDMPTAILVQPASQPLAFHTPGHKKKGWINGLLMVSEKAIGSSWAAVTSPDGANMDVQSIVLTDGDGKPLAPGSGSAVKILSDKGEWIVAFADPKTNARLPDGTPLEEGLLIMEQVEE